MRSAEEWQSQADCDRLKNGCPCLPTGRGSKSPLLRHYNPRRKETSVTVVAVAEGRSTLQRLGRWNAEGAAFSIPRPTLTQEPGREHTEAGKAEYRSVRPTRRL